MKRTPLQRTPFGGRRTQLRTEESYYPAFEALLQLHGLDWWHNTVTIRQHQDARGQAGWPDYTVFGKGWHAWVELKAVSPTTGRRGKVSVAQLRYKATIEEGACEWVSFTLPTDWPDVDAWLNAKTGHSIGRNIKL